MKTLLPAEAWEDTRRDSATPAVAVVIPVYQHPEALRDAVLSAVRSSIADRIKVVVVNDGCPYKSTHAIGRYCAEVFPDHVTYIRKANGGPSSARNYGIRLALNTWPSIEAVFPLDADNRLGTATLEIVLRALQRAPQDVGWVYQDLHFFGNAETYWDMSLPFSVFRLLSENYCDTASLIRRRVFDEGIWFDENMRGGYEDWEFFLHAALKGYRAVHAPGTGFRYGKRGHSRQDGALAQHGELLTYMREKHRMLISSGEVTRLEHREMPRFALIDVDRQTVRYATDPESPNQTTMSLDDFKAAVRTWLSEPKPKKTFIPPVVVFARGDVMQLLQAQGLLRGALFLLQLELNGFAVATLGVDVSREEHRISVSQGSDADPLCLALSSTTLAGLLRDPAPPMANKFRSLARSPRLTFEIGLRHLVRNTSPLAAVAASDLSDLEGSVMRVLGSMASHHAESSKGSSDTRYLAPHSWFAAQRHLRRLETTFPYARPGSSGTLDILVTTPWIKLGGVDQHVLAISRALRSLSSRYKLHLAVTEHNEVTADPRSLDCFETVSFLPSTNRNDALLKLMEMADVIINEHSMAAYQLADELRTRGGSQRILGWLHVVDYDDDDIPAGFPLIVPYRFLKSVDRLIVHSQHLKRWVRHLHVPDEEVVVIPNAPIVAPRDVSVAVALARDKAERRYSATDPVRLLFSGRFDRQKGFNRVVGITELLQRACVPYDLRILGKHVMSKAEGLDAIPGATVLPPTADPGLLAKYYSEADIFLMPSRWEGLPLALLEAMSFGNLVLATSVGAIPEVVRNGENGFLVDFSDDDEAVSSGMAAIVEAVVRDPGRYGNMRVSAAEAGMAVSWEACAEELVPLLEGDERAAAAERREAR